MTTATRTRTRKVPNQTAPAPTPAESKRKKTADAADAATSSTALAKADEAKAKAEAKEAEKKRKEAEKAEAEKVKAAAEAKAEKVLAPIAKEINVRLEKALKLDQQGDDHRLAAALQLEEARKKAEEMKINFKAWAEKNVTQKWETVRKLAAIGGAEDPKAALLLTREKNKEANKAARARKKSDTPTKAAQLGNANIGKEAVSTGASSKSAFQQASDAINALSDDVSMELLKNEAASHEMALVPLKEAQRLLDSGKEDAMGKAKAAFKALPAGDKLKFFDYVEELTKMHVIPAADYALLQDAKKAAKKAA
jgi:colicin import membrane protein